MPFQERRRAFVRAMGSGVAVFFSAPVAIRNNDVEHEYRQDSDLFYLTGFDEPECAAVLVSKNGGETGKLVMFVRPRDPEREVWDGKRAGIEGAKAEFGADEAYANHEFVPRLAELMRDQKRLFFHLGGQRAHDDRVLAALDAARHRGRSGVGWPTEIVDTDTTLHEMRRRKSEFEVKQLRRAAEITREGHLAAMQRALPGGFEYQAEAALREAYRRHGSERCAYPPIVGAGANATVLHYRANNGPLRDGDLLLIDSGAEYAYYACDVTRTFPVNGRFTREQRAVYDIVLEAQEASIAECRAGKTLDDVHMASVEALTRGLVWLGILRGEPRKLIEDGSYKKYYMHRTNHYLGMDVHDVGSYHLDGKPRPLDPGVVITVEPGLYFSPRDESVPAEYRGIGVRIEDDLVITGGAPDILTADIPRRASDVERACQR